MIRNLGEVDENVTYPTFDSTAIVYGGFSFRDWVRSVESILRQSGLDVTVELKEPSGPGTQAWANFGVYNRHNKRGNSAISTVQQAQQTSPEDFATQLAKTVATAPVTTAASPAHQVHFGFTNLTTGNPSLFVVGDKWKVTIRGQSGGAVRIRGTKNGEPFDVDFGTIPSSGVFEKTGSPGSGDIGNWVQTYTVDGRAVGSVSFSVVAKGASVDSGGVRSVSRLDVDPDPPKSSLSNLAIMAVAIVAAALLFNASD